MRRAITALALVLVAAPAYAGQNVLTWTDNSNNELNFNIERGTAASVAACQSGVTFAPLVTISANLVSFTDLNLTEGVTYCYRVNASNAAGASAFSNIAGRTVPFSVPQSPSGLTVN